MSDAEKPTVQAAGAAVPAEDEIKPELDHGRPGAEPAEPAEPAVEADAADGVGGAADGGPGEPAEDGATDAAGETAGAESDGEAARETKAPPGEVTAPDGSWRVTASRDLGTAYLDLRLPEVGEPDSGVAPPSAREILDAAVSLGVCEAVLFPEETLDRALKNTYASRIPLKRYAITEDRDATFEITVSADKLTAELTIVKGGGRGAPLDLKALGAAIRSSGLKGMDLERIKRDILSFYRSNETRLDRYVLCTGTAPVPGKPREVTWDVEFLPEERVAELKTRAAEATAEAFDSIESIAEKPVSDVEEMAEVTADSIIASLSPQDPGRPGVDVYGKAIAAKAGELPPLRLLENVRMTQEAIVAERDGLLDRWRLDEGDGYAVRVRPHRDASVRVNVSNDAMLASVRLSEGEGTGLRLTGELVRQTLIDADVIKGIDMEAIDAAIRAAADRGLDDEVVVARGQPPVVPGEGRIKFHIPLAGGKGVTIRRDGTADFKNQDRITTVEEGVLIAEIVTDETQLQDGWDVRSTVLPARAEGNLEVEIGENIRREEGPNGLTKLHAQKRGELVYDGRKLSVCEIHTIAGDVGPSTGNVKFPGSVNIAGSVLSGFFVMSKGTVKIAGGIDAALVSADESIHLQQGVKGGGKALLRARNEITAAFAENATLMSIGDTTIQNTCLQCNIKCNGKLSLVTDKGRLVGGKTRARNGVSAAQIGSASGVPTYISFGQDYLIGDKIELEEKEIEKLKSELMRLDGRIHAAERDGDEGALVKGRARKIQIMKLLEKRGERLFWLRERFEQHFPSNVEVRGTIYPGVVLESHDRILEITVEKKNVRFTFNQDSGRIVETGREEK